MGFQPRRAASPLAQGIDTLIEEWPCLDQEVLVMTRGRKVCITCHWFRHCAGVNCIPLLTCQLHQGLIAQGEHRVSRCQGWIDDRVPAPTASSSNRVDQVCGAG